MTVFELSENTTVNTPSDTCSSVILTSLPCSLLAKNVSVDSVAWDKGFVQQGIGNVKGSLIMSRLFSF